MIALGNNDTANVYMGSQVERMDRVERMMSVVGNQPVLSPGEAFEYTSWCVLATPSGSMRGTYQMVRPGGETFDAEIAPFHLGMPHSLN